jgi:CDGSH-type Zn-finger protein
MKTEAPVYNEDEPRKCGCGKTQDEKGNCDGSHAQ